MDIDNCPSYAFSIGMGSQGGYKSAARIVSAELICALNQVLLDCRW